MGKAGPMGGIQFRLNEGFPEKGAQEFSFSST